MTLQQYIEQYIVPRYAAFDKAHNLSHVEAVMLRSHALALQYEVDTRMTYTIAAYHDLGLSEGRELHHITSGQILAEDAMLKQWFTPKQIEVMREAVEDHRASSTHEPRSIYGCIVAEADRLIDPELTLRRTIQYGLKHLKTTDREEHYKRFVAHLMEKYAPGGYLRLWLPESDNARQLRELQAIIANDELLRSTFDCLYDEEISF